MPHKEGDKVKFINWERAKAIGLNNNPFAPFPERWITRNQENVFTIDSCINFGEDEYSLKEFPFYIYGNEVEKIIL